MNAKARRRLFGTICIVVAIGMLIGGQTFLKDRLSPLATLCYWLGCFLITSLAACVALVDALRIQSERRKAQRQLIEETIAEIEREKQSRKNETLKR